MLSPEHRTEIERLGSALWSGGALKPLSALEQVVYLLFLKRLEAVDALLVESGERSIYGTRWVCSLPHEGGTDDGLPSCSGHDACRWSRIAQAAVEGDPTEMLRDLVFPWLRSLPDLAERQVVSDHPLAQGMTLVRDASFGFMHNKPGTLRTIIATLDKLFPAFSPAGTGSDGTGEIFDQLVRECLGAARAPVARMPRHLARFVTALLDPQPGERICDPAAGIGGLLVSTLQHLQIIDAKKQGREVRWAWDGTPWIAPATAGGAGRQTEKPIADLAPAAGVLAGFERDPTLVRVGWMSLVLHGHPLPTVEARNPLGPAFDEFGTYDVVLCNPFFGQKVDSSELAPRLAGMGRSVPVELLMLILALDLLKPGGRAAVVVPDGILASTARAHTSVRRMLLAEHHVEAVIALPRTMFQPDATVNASIIVFRRNAGHPQEVPQTRSVWFYQVDEDGFAGGPRREPAAGPNDLWDALHKWPARTVGTGDYFQPELYEERWRTVDSQIGEIFPRHRPAPVGSSVPVDYLFPELPHVPSLLLEELVRNELTESLRTLYTVTLRSALAREGAARNATPKKLEEALLRTLQELRVRISLIKEIWPLQRPGMPSRLALEHAVGDVEREFRSRIPELAATPLVPAADSRRSAPARPVHDAVGWNDDAIEDIIRGFARLDGFDVRMRSPDVHRMPRPHPSKSWAAPVRQFAVVPEWRGPDGKVRGSHDARGNPRPEFIHDFRIHDAGGFVRPEYLHPDCIEASGFVLTAGRYQPQASQGREYPPAVQLIQRLREEEVQLLADLDALLAMVEGGA